jgi:hypothetical protein
VEHESQSLLKVTAKRNHGHNIQRDINPLIKVVNKMYGIQETLNQTTTQLKTIMEYMDRHGCYDPNDISLTEGLKRSVAREVKEALRTIPLHKLLEYFGKSGTTGISGAAYMIPAAISQQLYVGMQKQDICRQICADIIENPPNDLVNVNVGTTLYAKGAASGGEAPHETVNTTQLTLTLQKFRVAFPITKDLLEDEQYGLIEWHIKAAGYALARQCRNQVLTVASRLDAAAQGAGTKSTVNAGTGTTTAAQLNVAIAQCAAGDAIMTYFPDTVIITDEAWADAVSNGTTAIHPPQSPEWDAWINGKDVLINNSSALYGAVTSNRMTLCKTVVLQRELALIAAHKSWGRIDNYAEPIKDLAGAVVSGRQAVSELVKGAICVLTET